MTSPAPYPIPHDVTTPCESNPELMFPERRASPARIQRAKKVCRPCEYSEGCAAWALTRGEEGVWGGTTDEDRTKLRKELDITVVRSKFSPVPHGPRKSAAVVPHGTPVAVEHHRKRYEPLCDDCFGFDVERKGRPA